MEMEITLDSIKDLKYRRKSLARHPQDLLEIGTFKLEILKDESQMIGVDLRKKIQINFVQSMARNYVKIYPKKNMSEPKTANAQWTPGRLGKSILNRDNGCPTLHPSKMAPSNYLEKRGIYGGLYDEEDISYDLEYDDDLHLSELCSAVDERMRQFRMNRTLLFATIFKFEAGQFNFYENTRKIVSELSENERNAFYRMGNWYAMGEHRCLMSVRQVNLKAASLNLKEKVRSPYDELDRAPNDFLLLLYRKYHEAKKIKSSEPSLRKSLIKDMRNRLFQELSKSAKVGPKNHTLGRRKRTKLNIGGIARFDVTSGSSSPKVNKQ